MDKRTIPSGVISTDADFRLRSMQLMVSAVEALLRAAPDTAAAPADTAVPAAPTAPPAPPQQ